MPSLPCGGDGKAYTGAPSPVGKQVAVKFFSPQREENGMGRQMAAVRAHAAGSDPVKGATDQFSADDVADAVRREGNHERKME